MKTPHIELKLDTAAMEALFPEGSDARVKLQQAVIQNFVDRHIRIAIDSEFRKMVDAVAVSATADMKAQMSDRFTWQGALKHTATLTTDFKRELKRELKNLIDDEVQEILRTHRNDQIVIISERLKTLHDNIPSMVERMATKEIEHKVRGEILNKLSK